MCFFAAAAAAGIFRFHVLQVVFEAIKRNRVVGKLDPRSSKCSIGMPHHLCLSDNRPDVVAVPRCQVGRVAIEGIESACT